MPKHSEMISCASRSCNEKQNSAGCVDSLMIPWSHSSGLNFSDWQVVEIVKGSKQQHDLTLMTIHWWTLGCPCFCHAHLLPPMHGTWRKSQKRFCLPLGEFRTLFWKILLLYWQYDEVNINNNTKEIFLQAGYNTCTSVHNTSGLQSFQVVCPCSN